MRTLVLYFSFLLSILGVQSGVQLMQSGPEAKKPGESVSLSCKTSGFNLGSYWMQWVRQAPGKGLEWIGQIYSSDGDTRISQSFTGRVSMTADLAQETVYLKINSLKAEDTAVYYSARGDTVTHFSLGSVHEP